MKYKLIISGALILLLSSCTTTTISASFPERMDVLKTIKTKEQVDRTLEKINNPKGILSLDKALSLALMQNPKLAVYALEIRAREANSLQMSLLPNPELSAETENFAGSGIYAGMDVSETTISIGQLIELAGKREKRTQVAALESDVAAWDYEMAKLEIYSTVISAFTQALLLQEKIKLDNELLNIAMQLQKTILIRVQAGANSPAESARASVVISKAENILYRTRQQLKNARQQLATTWNGVAVFEKVDGKMDNLVSIPELDKIIKKLDQTPQLLRWAVEVEKRKSSLALSKAMAVPDPVISLAYRRINESEDNAFVAGLSIPLPFFDRNQGAIQEAQIRVKQAEWEKRSLENNLKMRIESVYINAEALSAEIIALKEKSIPNAEKAFSIISDGYQRGKFQLIDVLDAQRTLFESRNQLLQSSFEYKLAVNELEWLTGLDITKL